MRKVQFNYGRNAPNLSLMGKSFANIRIFILDVLVIISKWVQFWGQSNFHFFDKHKILQLIYCNSSDFQAWENVQNKKMTCYITSSINPSSSRNVMWFLQSRNKCQKSLKYRSEMFIAKKTIGIYKIFTIV